MAFNMLGNALARNEKVRAERGKLERSIKRNGKKTPQKRRKGAVDHETRIIRKSRRSLCCIDLWFYGIGLRTGGKFSKNANRK